MSLLSPLGVTGLHVTITPLLLITLLSLLLAVWLVFTIIVRYHWKNYGTKGFEILRMNLLYLIGSGILIAFTILSLLLYSTPAGQ